MPSVSVWRFEYEIMPNMNQWNVYIAAFTQQEAINHLQKTVNKPIRIMSTTMICRLDDVSVDVRKNVIEAFLTTQGKSKKEKENIENDLEEKKKLIKK